MSKDLFNQVDTLLEIHTEVNELPNDTFLLVLFLLKHEHVVVEELLQPLIGVVDAQLLEGIVLQIGINLKFNCLLFYINVSKYKKNKVENKPRRFRIRQYPKPR